MARGERLIERSAGLKAAAERAMLRDRLTRDEDEARRALRERAIVDETLDKTMARAEVLQQLAAKIESAIVLLERAADDGEEAAESLHDDHPGGILDEEPMPMTLSPPVSSRPSAAPQSAAPPSPDFADNSLEREFAALEVMQLERALRMSDAGEEANDVPREDEEQRGEEITDVEASGASSSPAWWQSPSAETSSPEPTTPSPMTPLEALLELDRARVSSAGVQARHVVALRVACAASGAESLAASDRLVGGKRDTAYRAAVDAAVEAVERTVGRGPPEETWAALAGYSPAVFLSDVARDIGVTPRRAGRLVANAVARRAYNRLLQAGASVRSGDEATAAAEVLALAAVLGALGGSRGGSDHLELVALGLERLLRDEERRKVMALLPAEAEANVQEGIRVALGL